MLAAATTLSLAGCGSDPPPAGPRVEIDTIGDTTIVRTLSGSVWAAEARLVPEVSIGELDGPDEYLTGRDGRIWVRLATAGQRVENESHDPEDPFSQPVTWEESTRYDVFEPDGSYLGVVAPPDGFLSHPDPVFDGDHAWAVARDELGVERVVRYRIDVDDRGGV